MIFAINLCHADDVGYETYSYQLGLLAFENANHTRAAHIWGHLAQRGDPLSQTALGTFYLRYNDVKKAVTWLNRAAEQDIPEALVNLGYLYSIGRGVEYDPERAAHFYQRAAELGSHIAIQNLRALRPQQGWRKKPAEAPAANGRDAALNAQASPAAQAAFQ